jgi:hypothetical protein
MINNDEMGRELRNEKRNLRNDSVTKYTFWFDEENRKFGLRCSPLQPSQVESLKIVI